MRGRIVRLVPVLLFGIAAVPVSALAAAQFVPLSEATVMHPCTRCDGRLEARRPDASAPVLTPAPYTPAAPARWVGRPHGPDPFPSKPPALS